MRGLRRLAGAAVVAAATAGPGFAQQVGGGATTGGAGGFPTGGLGGTTLGGTTTGTGSLGGTTTGTGGTAGTSSFGTTALVPVEQAPQIRAPSTYATTTAARGGVNASNFLAPTFANPYYSGILANARNASIVPGGFGQPTFGTATSGATGTGATGGIGAGGFGRTGVGAGGIAATDPGGVLVPLSRQIAYPAQVRFAAPPVAPVQLQTDLRGVIDRTSMLANPAGVRVEVNGNAVVLRGVVRDDDEARLVEGLVRLTPGVGVIRNELTYPRP
jgi:hypothetical protein